MDVIQDAGLSTWVDGMPFSEKRNPGEIRDLRMEEIKNSVCGS